MSKLIDKKSVIKVKKFLEEKLPKIELIELETTARSAIDAAKALNKDVGAIVKSILFKNNENNKFYLCLVSGDKYISIEKLSKLTESEILKADANECKNITGFSIGGVSPVAHKSNLSDVFIDINLRRFNRIYAAAGHPYVVFGISFDDLCLITKGKISNIVV